MIRAPQSISNNLRCQECPLCKSSQIHKVGDIEYGDPVIFSTSQISLSLKPQLWTCEDCESGFVQNTIPEKVAVQLYESSVGGKRWVDNPGTKKTGDVLGLLDVLFKKGLSVLDIGCNTGEMLDIAKVKGCETSGVEFCKDSIKIVREKGHAGFLKLEDITGRFDIITAFDLIEHLYDVPSFLTACHERLKPEGCLVLLTGDISCFSARLTKMNWWYVRYPEHIVFPSRKFLLSEHRFHVEKWMTVFANVVYERPVVSLLKSFFNVGYRRPVQNMIRFFFKETVKGRYAGLPSASSDHIQAVLRKR